MVVWLPVLTGFVGDSRDGGDLSPLLYATLGNLHSRQVEFVVRACAKETVGEIDEALSTEFLF
jgi:hypothetical protein